jgi:hypothetical protein
MSNLPPVFLNIRPTRIITSGTTISISLSDMVVEINKSVGSATTVNLMSSPSTGQILIIKDGKGDAGTNNITVVPASGLIDGQANFVINVNYGAFDFQFDGTNWIVL